MKRANDENIVKQIQISWDNVPLYSNEVGYLDTLCVEWCKNVALAEQCESKKKITVDSVSPS